MKETNFKKPNCTGDNTINIYLMHLIDEFKRLNLLKFPYFKKRKCLSAVDALYSNFKIIT